MRVIKLKYKKANSIELAFGCGDGRDRTADTRIFSPLLYQLSYITIVISPPFSLFGTAKLGKKFLLTKPKLKKSSFFLI
jgi:hypothetical protein